MYNYKYKTFYTKDPIKDKYGTTKEEIYSLIFENDENYSLNFKNLDYFDKFKLVLYWNYCEEIGKSFITKDHIGPLMARSNNRIDSLSKLFEIKDVLDDKTSNVNVISLSPVTFAVSICAFSYDTDSSP